MGQTRVAVLVLRHCVFLTTIPGICLLLMLCCMHHVVGDVVRVHAELSIDIEWSSNEWDILQAHVTPRIHMKKMTEFEGGLQKRHDCYEATFGEEIVHFCYCSAMVAGVPKCGTSAIYKWLITDGITSDAPVAFHPSVRKEDCFRGITLKDLWEYFQTSLVAETIDTLNKTKTLEKEYIMLSGCIIHSLNVKMSTLLQAYNTKYILMTRDYADLMWSAYNFWCSAAYDISCPSTRWVHPYAHYRSNTMFHELVVAKSRKRTTILSPIDHFGFDTLHNNSFYRSLVEMMWNHNISKDNVIVLASEGWKVGEHRARMMRRLMAFLDIPWTAVASENIVKLGVERTNTNNHKGTGSTLNETQQVPLGLYQASNFQPMFEETRQILDRSWRKDCFWISQLTRFNYLACHQPQQNETSSNSSSSSSSSTVL